MVILTVFSSALTSNLKSETYLLKASNLTSIYTFNSINMPFETSEMIIGLAARRRPSEGGVSRIDIVINDADIDVDVQNCDVPTDACKSKITESLPEREIFNFSQNRNRTCAYHAPSS